MTINAPITITPIQITAPVTFGMIGPQGPNAVTSATTSNGTATLSLAGITIAAFTSGHVVTVTTGGAFTTTSRSGIDTRSTFPPASHTHTASDITDFAAAVAATAPQAHSHGNITSAGAIGSTADLVVTTGSSGVLTTTSRSGIDSRASFPNADVTAATESATPGTLVRRGILNAQIQVEGLESTGAFGAIAADQTITTKTQFAFNKSSVFLALDASPTVNRAINFPDADGTVALTSDIVDSVTSATTSDSTANLGVASITSVFYRFPTQTSLDNYSVSPLIIAPDYTGQTTGTTGEAIYALPIYPLTDGITYLARTINADGTIYIDSSTGTSFAADTVLVSNGTNVSSLAYTEDNTPLTLALRDGAGDCSFNNVNASGIVSALTFDVYDATNTFYNRVTSVATANRALVLPNASGTIALTTSNVATATALETSRNIFGIAFNGTSNVSGDATNAGHFASIPTGGQAGHFITLNGTAPTVIAGRSAWWSDASGNPSFRNGTGTAVTLVRSSDLGTGVATALAVNVGSAGAIVANGGALGTPASGTLTNCTGLPISTGVSGLASGIATFLATPSSANLAAALTDEAGTGGGFVRAESPTLTTPTISGIVAITYSDNAFANGLTVRNTNTGTNSLTGITIQNSAGTNVGYMQYCPTNFTNAGLQNTVIFGSIGQQRVGFVANAGGSVGQDVYFKNHSQQSIATIFCQGSTLNVGIGTETPNSRAILDVASTTKGFLPPRMTTAQRDAISSPPAGLMIYNTTTNKLNFYNGSAWEAVTSA